MTFISLPLEESDYYDSTNVVLTSSRGFTADKRKVGVEETKGKNFFGEVSPKTKTARWV